MYSAGIVCVKVCGNNTWINSCSSPPTHRLFLLDPSNVLVSFWHKQWIAVLPFIQIVKHQFLQLKTT